MFVVKNGTFIRNGLFWRKQTFYLGIVYNIQVNPNKGLKLEYGLLFRLNYCTNDIVYLL